ncbi:MAG: hypothetical protein ACRET5_16255, partial [Steroidobacteraceae bacterium]
MGWTIALCADDLTQDAPLIVERVRLADRDIAVEGQFVLPQLARLGRLGAVGGLQVHDCGFAR